MTAFHGLALAVITTHGALATIFRSISGVMHGAVRRSSLLWYFRGGFAAYTSIIHHIIVDLPGLFVMVYLIQSLVLRTCLWTFVICVVDAPKLSCGFRIVPAEESSSHALHGATISVQYGYKTAIVIAFLWSYDWDDLSVVAFEECDDNLLGHPCYHILRAADAENSIILCVSRSCSTCPSVPLTAQDLELSQLLHIPREDYAAHPLAGISRISAAPR